MRRLSHNSTPQQSFISDLKNWGFSADISNRGSVRLVSACFAKKWQNYLHRQLILAMGLVNTLYTVNLNTYVKIDIAE